VLLGCGRFWKIAPMFRTPMFLTPVFLARGKTDFVILGATESTAGALFFAFEEFAKGGTCKFNLNCNIYIYIYTIIQI
jgi:hypothetical protein